LRRGAPEGELTSHAMGGLVIAGFAMLLKELNNWIALSLRSSQ